MLLQNHSSACFCPFEWYLNGKSHREDGHAYISYYETGQIQGKYWMINGMDHRMTGPAEICFLNNGQKAYELWFINNNRLTNEELTEYKDWLVDNNMLYKDILTDEEKVLWKLRWA